MRRSLLVALVAALLPLPAALPAANGAPPKDLPYVWPATPHGRHVVVAVVDTGVNLYHDFFRAPALRAHPSRWLPGFPRGAKSVPLTFGAESYADAAKADAATFAGMKRTAYDPKKDTYDEHLYTFPGTRIVGGISFGEYKDTLFPPADPQPVRDDHGHGTHSAGLVGGANMLSADGNVLIVAVEVEPGTFDEGIRWAARQPWIDALSVSLGTKANVPTSTGVAGSRTGVEWATYEAGQSGKPVFVASGNGVSNVGLAPDRCSTYTSAYTGPTWVTRIGAAAANNGNPEVWHCVPVDAIARTWVKSPSYEQLRGADEASGTSASTPNAAGHWAHLMLAARRAGSRVSRQQAVEYLLRAAAPAKFAIGLSSPSAYPLSLADQGYGLIDDAALDEARRLLLSGLPPTPRPETETWFEQDTAVRESLWATDGVMQGGGGSVPVDQNDAGSGGDAPNTRSARISVAPGTVHSGLLTGLPGDQYDWYAFQGTEGEALRVVANGPHPCVALVDPDGAENAYACGYGSALPATVRHELAESGTWYLRVHDLSPQPYTFQFSLDGP